MSNLAQKILKRDTRTLARVLSLVEDAQNPELVHLLKELYPSAGRAFIIGVTGIPGSGKSTLVDRLARHYSSAGKSVGIIAVDPTSPFSGGAILGDRIRMQSLSTDPLVFIRSMATRGKMGGLSAAVNDALLVLDAAGYEILIVETVGVGQDEIDIVRTAQATLLVLVPGMGDEVQAFKAGIMEIGDLLVINKADREGVLKTEQELKELLSLAARPDGWNTPIIKTTALKGEGIAELADKIADYRSFLEGAEDRGNRRLAAIRERLLEMLRERLARSILQKISRQQLDQYAEKMMTRELDPYTIVDRLLETAGFEEGNT
ncbi:MAG: methylmalonyl Co-A mutase-associated GTPase MeaB [Acidobacteriota bacterium]